jgi:hypothetical protein
MSSTVPEVSGVVQRAGFDLWMRENGGVRRGVAVVSVLLAFGGCSSDARPGASPADSTSSATDKASPTSTPTVEEPLPCVPGVQPFAGPAADVFGPEQVMAAYCLLAGLAEEQASTTLALPIPEQAPRDLERLRRLLTGAAAGGWEQLVADRAVGDVAATKRVNGLTLHDVRRVPAGYARADDGPFVFGTRVGPAEAELARGGEALALTFTVDTALVLEEDGDDSGRHSMLPVTREATYVLVPRGAGWAIADWDAEFRHGQVRLATG